MTTTQSTSTATGVTLGRVIRSEAIKSNGLRSTWWLIGSALVAPIVMTVIWTISPSDASTESVLGAATPSSFATLVILVLIGVLIATADAENHAAIQTYTVVPQRLVVVAAKFVLAFAISAAIAILTTFVTFAVADLLLGGGTDVWTPEALRVLVEVALFETCATLIALSAALLVRSTIAAVGVVFAFFYIVPVVFALVPIAAVNVFGKTIPGAGSAVLYSLTTAPGNLDPTVVLITMLLWTAAWILASVLVTRRRDV